MANLAIFIKFLSILFISRQGLICLFSFLSLIYVSYSRRKFKEGQLKEMVDNIIALAFITYLFTFFNILISGKFIFFQGLTGEFILNIFIILILVIIIKTIVDISSYNNKPNIRIKKIQC